MVIAASYPFLNVLWDILIFFAWVIFIWIAITVLIDVFRRHDISGWGKAAWVVFVVILPWIGVLTYLIVNHTGMAERRSQDTQVAQAQFDQYVRQAAGKGGRRERDSDGQAATGQRHDQPGGVRRDQGQGARVARPLCASVSVGLLARRLPAMPHALEQPALALGVLFAGVA